MKIKSLLISILALTAMSGIASAQNDEREPGLYAVYNGESIPLKFVRGGTHTTGVSLGALEIGKEKKEYKGVTSDVVCDGKFVMVCNMEKSNIKQTMKEFDVFVSTITPENMIIVPLIVDKKKRVYDEGRKVQGINVEKRNRIPFTWERISDNSYQIEAEDILPGEYAIVFKYAKLGGFDFDTVFDFTVPAEN